MSTETELKLRLDAKAIRRLRSHPLVTSLRRTRTVTRLLKSVYFDTADQHLRQRQLVLRVRHVGRRRIQTLKTVGTFQAGSWSRGEWETEISGDMPEWLALQTSGDAPAFLQDGRLMAELRPIFTTDVRRSTYLLADDDWEIELALDVGVIRAGDRSTDICEAELELKRGVPTHLFDLALAFQRDIPMQLMTATKAARGYALVDEVVPGPSKADPVQLHPEMPAGTAFRAIARSCFGQLLRNQDCLMATRDPEAIHQMRVALRRLRSAITVFKTLLDTPETAWLRDELSWFLRPLGVARDCDVFIEEIMDPLAPRLANDPGYQKLREDILLERQTAYDVVQDVLAQPRLTGLTLRLGRWIEAGDWTVIDDDEHRSRLATPVALLARSALRKRDRRISQAMDQFAELTPDARHQARIQVKKMRYSIDFFISLFHQEKTRRLSATLASLQDNLGLLNDIAIAERRLRELAERSGDSQRLWTAGVIVGWQAARVEALLTTAAGDWRRYHDLPRHWRAKDRA
ncbi:CHAD domain-containing protein [Telmatospirillum sp.]|uniref:CYTH and CHAD domain-containing protein n=1 Tax=Telmatospirillum sp. TaxID=2079197 RepID=UPI002844444C|nr:CHAD domain-containing protein [Telmatospirillum sp.]MDR3441230.1 CHAD domain-containing protein [Telmatospirillum sp.]